MELIAVIIQLVAGVAGGNLVGTVLKEKTLGTTGNSVAGAVGGVILGQIVERMTHGAVPADAVAAAATGPDIGTIIINLISSGVGGAILTAVVGMIKNK